MGVGAGLPDVSSHGRLQSVLGPVVGGASKFLGEEPPYILDVGTTMVVSRGQTLDGKVRQVPVESLAPRDYHNGGRQNKILASS